MAKTPRKKPDQPESAERRRKKPKKRRPSLRDSPLSADPVIAAPELDLRTLVLLSMGDWSELADLEWPPETIRRWLESADIRQVRGLLLTTLHSWHELRRQDH
jgi:hypothetical protein